MNQNIPLAARNTPQRLVLVLDDEPLTRWFLGEALRGAGFDAMEAGTIRQAVALCERRKPDAALLDARLPDGDGLASLEAVHAAAPNCRLVLMSAGLTPQLSADALRVGAADVLEKPLDLDEFVRVVTALLPPGEDGARPVY